MYVCFSHYFTKFKIFNETVKQPSTNTCRVNLRPRTGEDADNDDEQVFQDDTTTDENVIGEQDKYRIAHEKDIQLRHEVTIIFFTLPLSICLI